MSLVDLVTVPTSGPDDLGALKSLADRGFTANDVLALVAKSEGNGCVNDFSRTLSARVWSEVLREDAVIVVSGGTEGVLSPHVNLVCATGHEGDGLVAAVTRTAVVDPAELGRRPQAEAVRDAVRAALQQLGVEPAAVHLVLIKCPLLTTERIAACHASGHAPVTDDTDESMGRSRAASALGVALALGELDEPGLDAALAGSGQVWSTVASVSSGAELLDCQVLVLAMRGTGGRLRARHTVMRDAIDSDAVIALLATVRDEGGRVRQVFAKAEADPAGYLRGRRHTMLTDSDVQATRHARAAVGGLLAGLVGESCLYVSGGAEHQGPPGGGTVTVVYDVAS